MYNYESNAHNYGNDAVVLQSRVSAVMKSVYLRMTLGLLVTALTAMWAASSPAMLNFMFGNSWAMWVLLLVELGLVFAITGAVRRMSSAVAALLFFVFAVVNGLALTPIFLVYTHTSIAKTFFITAGTFGAMSVFGYFTNSDLTKFGKILFMALIGLIIASVVNIFTKSSTFDWIISIIGVFIFVGLTAWDTQQIKRMAMAMPEAGVGRLATLGALTLYLDFVNLFLYLLRFFGNNND